MKYALAYKIVKEEQKDLDFLECKTFTRRYYGE